MVGEVPARCVVFSISGGSGTPSDVSRFLDINPDRFGEAGKRITKSGRSVAQASYWELVEAGDKSSDVSSLLARMCERVDGSKEKFKLLNEQGWRLICSVVEYVSEDDEIGPGFAVDSEFLAVLVYIGSKFEVDLYVV